MNLFRLLLGRKFMSRQARKAAKASRKSKHSARLPIVEALEDRCLLSATTNCMGNLSSGNLANYSTGGTQTSCQATTNQTNCGTQATYTTSTNQTSCTNGMSQGCGNTISGYVFYDANNNGVMDSGELPLANTPIELLNNATNTIIGTTTTDANGYYQFSEDDTVSTAAQTITKTLTFPAAQTDYSVSGIVGQFDPSLGTLVSVSITNSGSITSDIQVENTSTSSSSLINGTVGGSLTLTGPNGLSILTNLSQYAGSYSATAYDGHLDFSGTSGDDFGSKTANGTNTITLSGNDLTAFIGTGSVQLTENAVATSHATGGGNLVVSASSTATAQVTVVYHYIPNNCLKPGNYTIVKTADPLSYIPGKLSSHGVVLNSPAGSNSIPVTLTAGSSANNDFGEIKTASISGYVYGDTSPDGYNDGVMEPDEAGISGVTVTLTGTSSQGNVSLTTTTDGNGFYKFNNLQPGTYTITESSPAGWIDGKASVGTAGGMATLDQINQVNLPPGTDGVNYNFGELQVSQIGGTVFYDGGAAAAFDNGVQNSGEPGIPGVVINLTGTDFNGHHVVQSTVTDANGHYLFNNLTPGTYSVTDVQPTGYLAGRDTVGTNGGQQTAHGFSNVLLSPGDVALHYDFAELLPSTISGFVYLDTSLSGYNDGIKEANEQGISGVTITLTGTTDQGSVSQQTTTDPSGQYSFANLAPGTYTITETPPDGYISGKATLGTVTSGQVGTNVLSNIALPPSTNDTNNNFAELTPSQRVFVTPPLTTDTTPNPPIFTTPPIPIVSKSQLLSSSFNKPSIQTQENAQFVNSVYTSVLGHSVDSTSLGNWLKTLQSGGTKQQVAAAVWNSTEHRTEEINALYQSILGTAPSQATVNIYLNMFSNGASELQVAAAIAGGTQATNAYPTTASFVNQMYIVAMGRTPSPSEQDQWANFAGNRTALAFAIFTTDEALTDIVQQTYLQLLNRPANATDVALWIPQLQAGGYGFTAMVTSIYGSAEYAGRMTV
jgi:protocatechuate 3,4-dioxygenase beta subunit